MQTHRFTLLLCTLAVLWFSLGGRRLFALTLFPAQVDPSKSQQRPAPGQPATKATGTPAAGELFRQRCVKCHGADGTGSAERDHLAEIPNFTNAAWQAKRTDAQLMASILDGKGKEMPPHREKVSEEQVRGLVAHVRAFAPATGKAGQGKQEKSDLAKFEERFNRLEKQLDESQREYRKLSKGSPDGSPSKPSKSRQHKAARQTTPKATGTPAAGKLFRQRCVKCHGEDGTGSPERDNLPEIPNFTNAAWQAKRTDAQLTASILDGKGKEMPPHREKVSVEQVRGLVAHVRAFAPTTGKSEQGKPKATDPAEPPKAKSPRGPFEKPICWVGKFHPAVVHFPIALMTSAAVAELLRMATGKPSFEAITRYCVWFGSLTALVAGILGWFAGGFHLTDTSRILMTHRWLGTSTVASAGLVLLLSEVSRRPERRRTRLCFQVTLLVVAVLVSVTGFFGGAVVFGLNHYAWPR
jgi:mono/diheme cytochrome c family protein/uncharacterized membrane protein